MRKMKKRKLTFERKIIKYELKHRDKVFLAIIGLFGAVFFFKGMSIILDNVNFDPWLAILVGVILMICSGYLIKKQ